MLEKMTIIDGIEDELANFFIILIASVVCFIAWRSTFVRDDLVTRTAVVIIDNNRRRLIDRVTQHPVTISILRSASRQSNTSPTDTEELDLESENTITNPPEETPPSLLSVLDEINYYSSEQNSTNILPETVDLEPQQIIQEMDNESSEGVRRRRVVYFEGNQPPTEDNLTHEEPNVQENVRENLNIELHENSNVDNYTNENNENTNLSGLLESQELPLSEWETDNLNNLRVKEDEMRIKLKYLNDELKLVQAVPQESLGDFKNRNFSVEIADHKFVRLVFNGHVLQPDTKTLQACGLFDNCVVHCLVHNRKPQSSGDSGNILQNRINDNRSQAIESNQSNPERNENGRLFVYFGMCCVSLALIFCWCCRFQYSYLFSWYSTTGLVLMTTIFLVLVPLNILIERESPN